LLYQHLSCQVLQSWTQTWHACTTSHGSKQRQMM